MTLHRGSASERRARRDGAVMMEYATLAILVSVACVIAVVTFGPQVVSLVRFLFSDR